MTCDYTTASSALSLRSLRAKIVKPVILTPQGAQLTPEEANLYAKHKPFGFILFKKHCESPAQLRQLIADLKQAAGEDCVISVDQEGGRVARLRGSQWPEFPAAHDMDDVYATYSEIGAMLKTEGFNLNYAPCLDVVPVGGHSDAIGDRCFSSDPALCGQKGIEACQGLLDAGVTPVIKHMPGHGRAVEDSHYHLPVVKASESELLRDLETFKAITRHCKPSPDLSLFGHPLPSGRGKVSETSQGEGVNIHGMTAHVIYECWDADKPATLSKTIIDTIIRGEIGFKGLLFSDDLAMKALDPYGDMIDRVAMALDAGCDIAVPCHTSLEQSRNILESL